MTLQGFTKTIAWSDFTEIDTTRIKGRDARTDVTFVSKGGMMLKPNKKIGLDPKTLVVEISLDPTGSWVVKTKETDTLLNHEQGHYNITALGARDFHSDLLALEADDANSLSTAVEQLNTSYVALIKKVNDMYDEDANCGTMHGTLADKQTKWDTQIKSWMNNNQGKLAAKCP